MGDGWRTVYDSDLQTALLPAAIGLLFVGFLVWQRQRGRWGPLGSRDRFVARYCTGFALVTLADLLASFPLVVWGDLGFDATSGVMVGFSVVADFRVFWLALVLLRPEPQRTLDVGVALLLAAIPMAIGMAGNQLIASFEPRLYGRFMWLIHQASMLAVVLVFRRRMLRGRDASEVETRFARWLLGYVALYYALFFIADAAILLLRFDPAWLLRCIPYQLYFSVYLPFVWMAWRRSRRSGLAPSHPA